MNEDLAGIERDIGEIADSQLISYEAYMQKVCEQSSIILDMMINGKIECFYGLRSGSIINIFWDKDSFWESINGFENISRPTAFIMIQGYLCKRADDLASCRLFKSYGSTCSVGGTDENQTCG